MKKLIVDTCIDQNEFSNRKRIEKSDVESFISCIKFDSDGQAKTD